MERGLAHASDSGIESVTLEVDSADDVLRLLLIGRGFTIDEGGGLVETWLAVNERPVISPLPDGYRLRHVLTSGIDRLVAAGAERIKICFEPDNPASKHLYLSAGFEPARANDMLSGPTGT